eukprot:261974_1
MASAVLDSILVCGFARENIRLCLHTYYLSNIVNLIFIRYHTENYFEPTDFDSDDIQEIIVTANDGREPITHFPSKQKHPVILCTVQLKITFNVGSFNLSAYGTGTVFAVDDNHNAFILTAAHNARMYFKLCAICDEWIKKCNHNTIHYQQLFKATNIECIRRSIEKHTFGDILFRQTCEIVLIDDVNYKNYGNIDDGYDIMLLKFKDVQNYYNQFTKHIKLMSVHNNMLSDISSFNIFGYPRDKYNQYQDQWYLYGMSSVNNDYNLIQNKITQKFIFKHRSVDTSKSQSGAALYYQDSKTKNNIIFGVHCGGKKSEYCNVATLIDKNIFFIHTLKELNDNINQNKSFFIVSKSGKYLYDSDNIMPNLPNPVSGHMVCGHSKAFEFSGAKKYKTRWKMKRINNNFYYIISMYHKAHLYKTNWQWVKTHIDGRSFKDDNGYSKAIWKLKPAQNRYWTLQSCSSDNYYLYVSGVFSLYWNKDDVSTSAKCQRSRCFWKIACVDCHVAIAKCVMLRQQNVKDQDVSVKYHV